MKTHDLSTKNDDKKISIYSIFHKDYPKIPSKLFIPIQVGKDIFNEQLGILEDNTGDNISLKNDLFGELTADYWAWKNDYHSDYIGFCHYRRYLCFKDNYNTIRAYPIIDKLHKME